MDFKDLMKKATEAASAVAKEVTSKLEEAGVSSPEDLKKAALNIGAGVLGALDRASEKVVDAIEKNPNASKFVKGVFEGIEHVAGDIFDFVSDADDLMEQQKEEAEAKAKQTASEQKVPEAPVKEDEEQIRARKLLENRKKYIDLYGLKTRERGLYQLQYNVITAFLDEQFRNEFGLTEEEFDQVFSKLMNHSNQQVAKRISLIEKATFKENNSSDNMISKLISVSDAEIDSMLYAPTIKETGQALNGEDLSAIQKKIVKFITTYSFINDMYNDVINSLNIKDKKKTEAIIKAFDVSNGEVAIELAYALFKNVYLIEEVKDPKKLFELLPELIVGKGDNEYAHIGTAKHLLSRINFAWLLSKENSETFELVSEKVINVVKLAFLFTREYSNDTEYTENKLIPYLIDALDLFKNIKKIKIGLNIYNNYYEIEAAPAQKDADNCLDSYIYRDSKAKSSCCGSFVVNKRDNSMLVYESTGEFEEKMQSVMKNQEVAVITNSEKVIEGYNPQAWLIAKVEGKYCKIPLGSGKDINDNKIQLEIADETFVTIDLNTSTIIDMDPTSEIMNDIRSQINTVLKRTVHTF